MSGQRYTRDELLTEWAHLRRSGVTVTEAAPRLGLTVAGLTRALERARAAGDPRAQFTTHGAWRATHREAS